MAKQTGLGDGLVVDGIDLSGDTGGLQAIGSSRPTTGVTGINSSARERLHLRRDGRIDWSSFFNPDNAHAELSTLPTTDRIVTYLRGQVLGNPAASLVSKQLNYDSNRNADGSISFDLQARANGFGLEWGLQLTAGFQEFVGPGAGTTVDPGTGTTAFGLQAYAHLLAVTGTPDVDVEIQDVGGTIGTGVAFPTFTAVGAARIQSDRDESVTAPFNIAVSGTFITAILLVVVTVNEAEVLF